MPLGTETSKPLGIIERGCAEPSYEPMQDSRMEPQQEGATRADPAPTEPAIAQGADAAPSHL